VHLDLVRAAYASPQWREASEAVRIATGVTVAVVEPAAGTLWTTGPIAPCDALCRDVGGPGSACVAARESGTRPASPVRWVCEGGMLCTLVPVRLDGRVACHVLVTGFVGSSQERRRMLQRLLSAGVTEQAAREVTEAVPVLTRERADAVAKLVASRAELTLRELTGERHRAGGRRSLDLLSDVAHDLGLGSRTYDSIPAEALATVLRLTGGACARLSLTRTASVSETIAEAGDCSLLPLRSEMVSHVVGTGRSLVVAGRDRDGVSLTALAVPLRRGDAVAGVLEVAKTGSETLGADDVRLVELFGEIVSAMLDNAEAFRDTNTKLIELIQVNEVAKAMNATLDYERLSELTVQVLSKTLEFGIGGFVVEGFGARRGRVTCAEEVSAADVAVVVAEATGGSTASALDGIAVIPRFATLVEGEGPTSTEWTVLSAEIRFRDVSAGRLFVSAREPGAFRAHDERILEALAAHLSTALENATVYQRLDAEFSRTMAALSALADAHECRADGHTDRVMDYGMALGHELGLPVDGLELIRLAGLLHDVGKAGVAREILLKPSALTADEMERVRRHSESGASILDQLELLEELPPIVRQHPESFDGSGYPDGLAGDAIPLEARILAVADAYEVMTSKVAHRKRFPAATARLELERCAGTRFDPSVVSAFLRVLDALALPGASGSVAPRPAPSDGPQLPA
jgi:putative nucleotidyltransferase with HDIG domain